jgi:holliday junction DNA helicase RuvA
MIASLRGILLSKRPDHLIIDVNGVGYRVVVPVSTLSSLPGENSEVFLFIYTHVREDIFQLFGFSSEEDKRIFITLLGVSGIGPKIALNILSTIPADIFHSLVHAEDVASLCRVPGLGKKTAQRIILELREKLPAMKERKDMLYEDTLSALLNLGYKRNIAQDALDKAYDSGNGDIESLLREALKYLTKE